MAEKYLGYLKYSGDLVAEGYMDARKAAQALLSFDQAIRYFVGQQDPELREVDFELPVRIRKGSWEALIPQDIEAWVRTAICAGLSAYAITAAKKTAENDFKDMNSRKIFLGALKAILWMLKIGKHTGDLTIKTFQKVVFKNGNELIGIRNSKNEILYVPRNFLELYAKAPPLLLSGIAQIVEKERVLTIGVGNGASLEEESLTVESSAVFTAEEPDPEEILFPELQHGMHVLLEGELTRGNETSNTLGLRYHDHILTCFPASGSVVRWKNRLFSKCNVHGTISRSDENGQLTLRRPRIAITKIDAAIDPKQIKLLPDIESDDEED